MNKNQKARPYTCSNLIWGNLYSKHYHLHMIAGLNRQLKSPKITHEQVVEIRTKIAYHQGWVEYFQDQIAHFQLVRSVCGDATTLVR